MAERDTYKDRINIFHYNDKTSMYKALAINPTNENDAAFFSIREGMKGSKPNSLSLKFDKKEIAFMILEMQKMYNELD